MTLAGANCCCWWRRWLCAGRRALVVFAVVATHASSVRAAEVVYKKHTVVNFGDDTIEGDLTKPDGQYLESRKQQRHQRLIKVRQSFRMHLLQSVRAL